MFVRFQREFIGKVTRVEKGGGETKLSNLVSVSLIFRCEGEINAEWKIYRMNFDSSNDYWILYWSGNADDPKLKLITVVEKEERDSLTFYK